MGSSGRFPEVFIHKFFKKGAGYLLLFSIIFALISCQTYWRKRVADLGDPVTIHVHNHSYGVTGRISFLKMGVFFDGDEKVSYGYKNNVTGELATREWNFLFLGYEEFRGKKEPADAAIEKILKKPETVSEEEKEKIIAYLQKKKEAGENNKKLFLRKKLYSSYYPFGLEKSLRNSPYFLKENRFSNTCIYGDIQLTAGLYYGITLGVNFLEILDFLTGFFNADILGDDMVE